MKVDCCVKRFILIKGRLFAFGAAVAVDWLLFGFMVSFGGGLSQRPTK